MSRREGGGPVQAKWCVDLEAQQKGLDVLSSFQIEDTGRESGDEAWGLSSESQSPPGQGTRILCYCAVLAAPHSTYLASTAYRLVISM